MKKIHKVSDVLPEQPEQSQVELAEKMEKEWYRFEDIVEQILVTEEDKVWIDFSDETVDFYVSMKKKWFSTKIIVEEIIKMVNWYSNSEIN